MKLVATDKDSPHKKSPPNPRHSLHTQAPMYSLTERKSYEEIQKQYDAKLAELDRLIAENNAKLAANHLAMHEAIADAQTAIATAIEKLSK